MNTILSIDLGSHTMHMAEGVFQKNAVHVKRSASFPIPEGSLVREAVAYPQLLADAIQSNAHSAGFQAKDVVITMNADFAIVRDVDLPPAKPKELEAMIGNEMAESFYISKSDIIQFKEIDRVTSDLGEPLTRYRVAAIDRDLVESFHQVLKLTKLKALAMDINLNAIDKLFSKATSINGRPLEDKGTMLIDFGHSGTTLYVVAKGKPLFFRRLPIGSGEIDHMVSETLQASASESRELKEKELSFFNGSEKSSAVFSELNPFFVRFSDEVRKIISFYNNRSGSAAVDHICLFGNGSKLAGLPEYLAANLGLPVERISSMEHISLVGGQALDVAHINAIGSLIRYEK